MRKQLYLILIGILGFNLLSTNLSAQATFTVSNWKSNSALANGDWFKVSVGNTGIFKLTPAYFNESGITNGGEILINEISVFGNGTGILPASNAVPRKDDINEIPCKAVDNNNNGVFDGNDYILFFANGPHTWTQIGTSDKFQHNLNFYRDHNYYFINIGTQTGKRIQPDSNNPGSANITTSTYDDYSFTETEEENLVGTGRIWLGDIFDFTLERNYGFNFVDRVYNDSVDIRLSAVGRVSTANTTMDILYNNGVIMSELMPQTSNAIGASYANRLDTRVRFLPTADNFSLKLRYNNSANPSGVAWLDFIEVQLKRNLQFRKDFLYFRDLASVGLGNIVEYQITNADASIEIWDVTDLNNVHSISSQLNGSTLSFVATADSLREFVAVKGSGFNSPTFVSKLVNQDLHAMGATDMIIVVHPNFKAAAERLAEMHRNIDNMTVEVVDVHQIYNEFSSGGQDITAIRDFVRMVYTRNSGGVQPLKYLLLFGDASYDYRDRLSNNNNYVPIWQDVRSPFSLYGSAVTDDYYGAFDLNEGVTPHNDLLEIGIGRIPCETSAQAESYVDKVIHYVTGENRFGDWRNKVLLMADDVDEGWETTFVTTSEELEVKAKNTSNSFVVEKIYTDSYKQLSTSGSQSYPEASADMFRKVQSGNLVTNYIGHGGEISLSSEKLLKLTDIGAWTNYDAMPLFITITCEFTRVDDPKRVSAGEQLLLNPNGGAIALISTTRVVDVLTATNLNKEVFDSLLTRPVDNLPKRLGEIIKDSKNGLGRGVPNKLKFSLFGDPAMRLAIPFNRIQTNSINGKPVASGQLDTVKALSKVQIAGQVNDVNDQKIGDFNGILNVSVFDKPSKRQTLANDGVEAPLLFNLQNNLIYKGKVEVKNGEFTIEFLTPFDIAYQFGFGKVSYYSNNGALDAAGVFDTLVVGGFNNNAEEDEVGPTVELFMNDESFVRGGLTGPDPVLLAILADSSGINTVGSSVGHDIVAIIDDETDKSFVINEFYEADLNSYKSGRIRYPIFDLEPGNHNLKLKVFDVYNNFTKAETDFVVAESATLALKHVLNYPNPFTTYTEFQFEHNRANEELDVQVQIFTVSGKLVKTINAAVNSAANRVTGIAWNGLDDYGDKIGRGVYVYKLKVKAKNDNAQAEEYEKLVILR